MGFSLALVGRACNLVFPYHGQIPIFLGHGHGHRTGRTEKARLGRQVQKMGLWMDMAWHTGHVTKQRLFFFDSMGSHNTLTTRPAALEQVWRIGATAVDATWDGWMGWGKKPWVHGRTSAVSDDTPLFLVCKLDCRGPRVFVWTYGSLCICLYD